MSESKNHHYVPQWLMKSWADENDRVIVVDRRNAPDINNFVTHVKNINTKCRLYTLEKENGERHDKLETEIYGPLDYAADDLTKELCRILDSKRVPDMNSGARTLLWQFYYYNAYKRLPDTMEKYLEKIDFEDLREKTIQKAIEEGKNEKDYRRVNEQIDIKSLMKREGVQYARAEQNEETLNALAKFGVVFAIAAEGTNFILPDRSLVIPTDNVDLRPRELWIPINPKYAFRGVTNDPNITLVEMNKFKVRQLNENWYANANTVISKSKKQAVSLVKRHDRQRISF